MQKRLHLGAVVLLGLSVGVWAAETYRNIVVASGASLREADIYTRKLQQMAAFDPRLRTLQAKEGFVLRSRKSGNHFIATIEPIYDDAVSFEVLALVQRTFPDAYIFTHRGDIVPPAAAVSPPAAAPSPASVVPPAAVPAKADEALPELSGAVAGLALLLLLLIAYLVRQQRKIRDVSRELERGKTELESVIERQEDMMVNVGEKIRTPAKAIIDSSDQLLRTDLDPLQSRELRTIRYSDELLLDITNDLIDFLNLKSDKLLLRHERFNINNVLDEVAGTVSGRARGSRVEFIFDIEKEVPAELIGDPLRLGQILTNLCSNAMKFTAAGEVRLHIRLKPSGETEKMLLQFAISDTGIGIKSEQQEEIFEPFSSANNLKETGLGLYISRALTERMGGTIELKSQLNRGSDFYVTLPFDLPDPSERRHYRLPSVAYTGRKVVIIEVQPTAADALKKMLEYFKNSVAVRSVAAIGNKSDLLFGSDMVIVAENAFTPEVTALIRRVKRETGAKIVLAGNMLDAPHDITPLEPLIDARIMKPLSLQRVYDLIVDLLEEGNHDDAAQTITPRHTSPTAVKQTPYAEIPETPNVTRQSFVRFSGASLLVVEDNLINQKVLLSLLGGSGIRVRVANDGVEALNALEEGNSRFDLVLMDINMPVMDGYEATKHIRAVPAFNDLPIVSLTGLGLPEEVAKMYALGMNAHLIKPIHVGRLYTVFERYLPKAEAPAAAQEHGLTSRYRNTPGLAAADGLKRASGDVELYGQILEEFAQLYAGADDTVRMLLRSGDLEEVKKFCLDIKGVSANIGADAMAEAAEALHMALSRNDGKAFPELTDRFGAALQELLKAVRKYLP